MNPEAFVKMLEELPGFTPEEEAYYLNGASALQEYALMRDREHLKKTHGDTIAYMVNLRVVMTHAFAAHLEPHAVY